jgi:alpha-glucosidase
MPSAEQSSWWKEAVFYQIYPRSFLDTNGDGIGDLEGIRRRLDHIVSLGVDALWLNPPYPSPNRDFGYDVTSLCDVDPAYGDLAELERLVSEAHGRGLKVILDWVGNHASDQHPWFLDAASSRQARHRDWFIWRDGTPDVPPNNWQSAMGGPAWTWHEPTGQWYLHFFLASQPDVNWANPDLADAMRDTLRFWLDRGVDGFRLDVPHCMGKDRTFADNPQEHAHLRRSILNDCDETHDILRSIRKVLDEYPERMTVGEVNLLTIGQLPAYVGTGDELHLVFNFPPTRSPWDTSDWHGHVAATEALFSPSGAWPTWFLSNHDYPRHRTRYGGSEGRARAAAVLLLSMRGTPFLFAGEELGLEDATVAPERVLDPIGRDGCRAPIPWDASPSHGWGSPDPWLPWPPDADRRNAESLAADADSILGLYRRLLAARKRSAALRSGDIELLAERDGVLSYIRTEGDDRRAIAISFVRDETEVALPGAWVVDVSTSRSDEGQPFSGRLGPDAAVVLRPA